MLDRLETSDGVRGHSDRLSAVVFKVELGSVRAAHGVVAAEIPEV